jgi:glycosyltransferase involved in cell wall biosynthesis
MKGDDPLARETAAKTAKWLKPDRVFFYGEPGSTTVYQRLLAERRIMTYQLIEGAPIVNGRWIDALASVDNVAASEFAANEITRVTGKREPWVYPGVDHSVFEVTGQREELRRRMVRDDAFIIMTVAQNVRRKQITRLIEAVSILRHQHKRKNVILYIHASPFQDHWLEGWNLFEITQAAGIADITVFHPGTMNGLHSFVPERTNDLAYPGLVEMYNTADLFVLPSQVEGFGLPIAEAMACGLPVAVTKYAAGWEVAGNAGKGIPVHDWEISKSGQRYGNVNPVQLADTILKLMRNPNELKRMREAGLQRAQDFQWEPYRSTLVQQAERVGDQASGRDRQAEDSQPTRQETDEHLREGAQTRPAERASVLAAG